MILIGLGSFIAYGIGNALGKKLYTAHDPIENPGLLKRISLFVGYAGSIVLAGVGSGLLAVLLEPLIGEFCHVAGFIADISAGFYITGGMRSSSKWKNVILTAIQLPAKVAAYPFEKIGGFLSWGIGKAKSLFDKKEVGSVEEVVAA